MQPVCVQKAGLPQGRFGVDYGQSVVTGNNSRMKGVLALTATCVLLAVSVARLLTGRSLASAIQGFGIAIMAATHVFEAFSLLPELESGRPGSVGHFYAGRYWGSQVTWLE